MSYLVLARKSRPQNFDEVVGQRPVVKTLQNSLVRHRVAHAILFSGVRGVGKTTLARIMAKAVNCVNGPALNPCNTCDSCKAITAGSSLDLYEIDGASNRGIQEIRELKEKIRFLPVVSKHRVIIIDEVHMLTNEAFNALLKTLEEPPAHVYFMFATTELHKIPVTILSRCQRYELKRVSPIDLGGHLQKLAEAEGVQIDKGALDLVVREADGSVRDGLSLLDQVFSFGEKNILVDDVVQVLGLVDRELIFSLTEALLEQNPSVVFQALDEIFSYGMDLKRFTADLLSCCRSLILCKIKGCEPLLDISSSELARLQAMAANHSLQSLHLQLSLLMRGVEELRHSGQPRLLLETTFLKILQSGTVTPVTTLLARFDAILADIDGAGGGDDKVVPYSGKLAAPDNKKPAAVLTESVGAEAPVSVVSSPLAVAEKPAVVTEPFCPEAPVPAASSPFAIAPPDAVPPSPPVGLAADSPVEERVPAASAVSAGDDETEQKESTPRIEPHQHDIRRDWMDFIAYVRDRSVWMAQNLQQADLVKEQGHELLLHYQDAGSCSMLRRDENRKQLMEFVLDFFQKDLTIRFVLPKTQGGTNAEGEDQPLKERHLLANDPLVMMTAEIFNGQIGDIRVGARFR